SWPRRIVCSSSGAPPPESVVGGAPSGSPHAAPLFSDSCTTQPFEVSPPRDDGIRPWPSTPWPATATTPLRHDTAPSRRAGRRRPTRVAATARDALRSSPLQPPQLGYTAPATSRAAHSSTQTRFRQM